MYVPTSSKVIIASSTVATTSKRRTQSSLRISTDESLRTNEDWDMWLRLAEHYRFAKVPEVLVFLRQHDGQAQGNAERMADSVLQLCDKLDTSIAPHFRHQLPRIRWYNHLTAAERYCATSKMKCWRALALALRAWPLGFLSFRTWYVLILSLGKPLYVPTRACYELSLPFMQ